MGRGLCDTRSVLHGDRADPSDQSDRTDRGATHDKESERPEDYDDDYEIGPHSRPGLPHSP